MAYTVLRISDGFRSYPFLFDGTNIYWPDYNPLKFGRNPQYCLQVEGYTDFIFNASMCEACVPFIHESYKYQQCIPVPHSSDGYVALIPWNDNQPDPNYISAQGKLVNKTLELSADIVLHDEFISIVFNKDIANPIAVVQQCYGAKSARSSVTMRAEIAIMDGDDMYWHNDTSEYDNRMFNFKLINFPYGNQYQWKDNLKIAGIVHFEIQTKVHSDPSCGDIGCTNPDHFATETIHVSVRTNPFPITQERYGRLLHASTGQPTKIDIPHDMVINRPRFINKTIQNVVEMTAQTDSKSNIIQPVFFRSRELASIIVHPAVTENICINLDAYKASVERFYIKIEGVAFYEIGRTESGVIFKISGNMLPGQLTNGTYYILNQDAELVTTGKYKYES